MLVFLEQLKFTDPSLFQKLNTYDGELEDYV